MFICVADVFLPVQSIEFARRIAPPGEAPKVKVMVRGISTMEFVGQDADRIWEALEHLHTAPPRDESRG